MIFKGVAPDIRYCDPEYNRFTLRLYMQHVSLQFQLFNEEMRKAMVNMGVAFKVAGESMRNIMKHFSS